MSQKFFYSTQSEKIKDQQVNQIAYEVRHQALTAVKLMGIRTNAVATKTSVLRCGIPCLVFCGWETAGSQIRLCITLCALYATYLAYTGIMHENRKTTDQYLQSAQFFSFLMVTTALFDLLAIFDSLRDNQGFCHMVITLHENVDYEQLRCSVGVFGMVFVVGLVTGVLQVYTYGVIKRFRQTIAIDNL